MKYFLYTISRNLFFIVLLLISFLFFTPAYTQPSGEGPSTDMSIKKMKVRASNASSEGDIYTALFYYQQVVNARPADLEARYQLAEMHRLSRNYSAAEKAYSFLVDSAKGNYPFALFYKAQMQKMTGNYEEAKKNILLFRKQYKNLGDKDFKKLLGQELAGCDSGMVYREFPENIQVTNAGKSVNKPHTEFSPFQLDSTTLLYGSLREDSLRYYSVREEYKEILPMRQLYKAERAQGAWIEKGKFDDLNDSTMEMGNFVYSANSGKFYFTKCTKNNAGHVLCKIYVTEKSANGWTPAVALPNLVNLEGFTTTQPAIVFDTVIATPAPIKENGPQNKPAAKSGGKQVRKPAPKKASIAKDSKPVVNEYLYFVSDRPEGKGGLDIWYTSYNTKKKEWAAPVNAGVVNTPETECTPYYHTQTQTLYFSSDGLASAGGLDIYKTWKQDKRYVKPQNLSFPINSPQDDLGFMLSENAKTGFLVSNRPGGTPFFHETCCDDIYTFEILPTKPFKCTLDLLVQDADTIGCKDQLILVQTTDLKTKQQTVDTILVKNCKYELPLRQKYQYKFYTNTEGYEEDTLTFETRDMSSADEIEKKLILRDKKAQQTKEVVSEKPIEGVPFVLIDIQYETDETTLNPEAQASVDTLLVPFLIEHSKDKVVVNSHTDDHGSHKYNMRLSQARAANVVKYLISKGIDPTRLEGHGYGETRPIAPNKDAEGNDNPIGRSLNRRTEFLITKPQMH